MREQMDRQRDEFFNQHPRDWPSDTNVRSGFFNKGFHVTIYDLGGSKSFRGIWPKYYHEVHGFIFVVDSADPARLAECSSVLQSMLGHPQVYLTLLIIYS